MTTAALKQRLIESIQKTQDVRILEEASRLLDLEQEASETYPLNAEQQEAVNEARKQIIKGQFLTNDQANSEIDEWLKK